MRNVDFDVRGSLGNPDPCSPRPMKRREASTSGWVAALCLFAFVALWLVTPRAALAAPGDAVCTVSPSPVRNLAPTLVVLSSAADDVDTPISAHIAMGHTLTIRDPGGDRTGIQHGRIVTDLTAAGAEGQDIAFLLPAANMAGEFEVLTLMDGGTSDCLSGVSGIYDGLAINQGTVVAVGSAEGDALRIELRGTLNGRALLATTTVTVSAGSGEFFGVNGEPRTPSRVAQLTLTAGAEEGAAVGTLDWRAVPGEEPGAVLITATAQQDGVSLFKNVTGTITAPPPNTPLEPGSVNGELPLPGVSGLLVTAEDIDASALLMDLFTNGCAASTVAVVVDGSWLVLVAGAPEPVNAEFPTRLAAGTPFFVRCAGNSGIVPVDASLAP